MTFEIGVLDGIEKTASMGSHMARTMARRGAIGAGFGAAAGALTADKGRKLKGAARGAVGGGVGGAFFSRGDLSAAASGSGFGALWGTGETKKHDKFKRALKQNPKTPELNQAFAMYKRETGKDPSKMSYDEIHRYVKKVRRYA